MSTDIKLKDYILYKYKDRIKKKGLIILNVIDNIKWKYGVLQFHSAYTRAATVPWTVILENMVLILINKICFSALIYHMLFALLIQI
jgi:hypothetical protein